MRKEERSLTLIEHRKAVELHKQNFTVREISEKLNVPQLRVKLSINIYQQYTQQPKTESMDIGGVRCVANVTSIYFYSGKRAKLTEAQERAWIELCHMINYYISAQGANIPMGEFITQGQKAFDVNLRNVE